jgi:4-hydroxy-tetrahydrodipicolinate synthase
MAYKNPSPADAERPMFKGSMVALVTPMLDDGTIDQTALAALIEWHIQAKTEALVIAGTTGESATLSEDEQFDLIRFAVQQAAGRIPIIAGTGTNSTTSTLQRTLNAEHAGAAAALIVTPYYNKPTQAGLYAHYHYIATHCALPLILYNVPTRTACDLLSETVIELAKIKRIIGLKDATGKIERVREIVKQCSDFLIYSGDDATALELMLNGGHGVISVTANVAPEKMYAMTQAALAGKKDQATQIDTDLKLLHECLFVQSNPIPTKWVLEKMGKIKGGIRLPLLPLESKYHDQVKEAMQNAGVYEV